MREREKLVTLSGCMKVRKSRDKCPRMPLSLHAPATACTAAISWVWSRLHWGTDPPLASYSFPEIYTASYAAIDRDDTGGCGLCLPCPLLSSPSLVRQAQLKVQRSGQYCCLKGVWLLLILLDE